MPNRPPGGPEGNLAPTSVTDLLQPGSIRVGVGVEDKDDAIRQAVALLEGRPEVEDLARVQADVEAREAVMSTGVGQGLGLPHARSSAVTGTAAALLVVPAGVDFEAIDGQPVRLVFLLVGPEGERGRHVKLLSRISRLMNRDAFRQRLLEAPDEEAVLRAFRETEEALG